jgi:hypothetical protein
MMRISFLRLAVALGLAATASLTHAKQIEPADYPLRVHVFSHSSHSHYSHRELDYSDGEGRANLYENSQPTAFDFSFRCMERIENSIGYETYIARWKKPGRTLEIMLPRMGHPDQVENCEFQVILKPGIAYTHRNGEVSELPTEAFRQWMVEHDYDPEHGKEVPIRAGSGAPAPGSN